MAKQFIANRSGQTPTLDEVPNETIKIYTTEADADADLANLEENEIFATDEDNNPASGTQYPVDAVQDGNMHAVTSNAVYTSCPRFPDYARGSIYTTVSRSITVPEDAYIIYMSANLSQVSLRLNGVEVSNIDSISSANVYQVTFIGYVKEGDVIERSDNANISLNTLKMYGLIGE